MGCPLGIWSGRTNSSARSNWRLRVRARKIDAIANNPEPPTFENTIAALEMAGRELVRLQALFGVHSSNLNVGPIPDIERVVVPKLAEYEDRITQNEALFARIAAVYQGDALRTLNSAQRRLAEKRYKDFVRQGETQRGGQGHALAD